MIHIPFVSFCPFLVARIGLFLFMSPSNRDANGTQSIRFTVPKLVARIATFGKDERLAIENKGVTFGISLALIPFAS
jgi:hypothetical protein